MNHKKLMKFAARMKAKRGFKWEAKYILMFDGDINPYFWNGSNAETEKFYKRCVQEKKSWREYTELKKDFLL